jgi:hypothetical protein
LFNSWSKQYFSILDTDRLDLNWKFTFSAVISISDLNILLWWDFDIISKSKWNAWSIFEPYRFTLWKQAWWEFYFRTTNFISNWNIYQKANTWYIFQTSLWTSLSLTESWSFIPYIYERDIYFDKFDTNIPILIISSTYNEWLYYNYINWIKVNNIYYKNKNIWNSNWDLLLWSRSWTSNYFNWIIDDIKIYNRALSDSEIAQQSRIAWFSN